MEEEYIDIPYGRDGRESGVTTLDERERARDGLGGDNEQDSASEYPSPNLSSRSPLVGLSGLSARLKGVEDDDELVAGNKSGDDVYDKYGRSSVESTRSIGNNAPNARMVTVRTTVPEDQEKLRREYEYKIATMQTQITNLQRDLGDNAEHEKKRKESENKVRQLEEELGSIRQVKSLFITKIRCG
jgi:protein SPA2